MANRQTTLLLKRSNIPGKIPNSSGLTLGELALNTADVILYTSGTTANQILPIGWDRVHRTGDTINGDLTVTGSGTFNSVSATTYYNLPLDVYVTGGTYSAGTITFTNNGGGTFNVSGLTSGSTSGVSGDYLPLSGGTVTGGTIFTSGVTANTITTDIINFNTGYTGTTPIGSMNWNGDFGIPEVGMIGGNVVQKIGESIYSYVRNAETTTLSKGEVVYIFGATGDKISVKRAANTGDTTSSKTLGVVAEDIISGGIGYVITQGTLDGLNLGAYTAGDVVWLSSVPGQFTKVKQYSPYHLVFVGVIQRANNGNGQLYVKPQNGYELEELHDVVATGATFGDLIAYSAINGNDVWVNTKILPGSYTITGNTIVGGGLTATTISATTYQNLPTDIRVTGASYNNNTFTFTNNTGGTFTTSFNTVTGLTINGNLTTTGNTSLQGLTATTISATTYQNLPVSGLTAGSNVTITGSNSNFTISASITTGPFGISNSGGTYTYYSSFTQAMSAATAGQTIEMFADVTETGNVTVTLKDGVIINGNGHTYTYTNNSGNTFSDSANASGTFAFYNINITRTNTTSTGAVIFAFAATSVFATSRLDFNGCVIRYNVTSGNSQIMSSDTLKGAIINKLNCITNGAGWAVSATQAITLNNCYIECNGTSGGATGCSLKQCVIQTQSGCGISSSTSLECVVNCITSGIGINAGTTFNCIVTTNTGNCFDATSPVNNGSASAFNCVARTTSGVCFYSTTTNGCWGYSGTGSAVFLHFNYGDGRYKYYNSFFTSGGAITVNAPSGVYLTNCTISSTWANAGGHAIRVSGTGNDSTGQARNQIINCVIETASSSANCINSTASSDVKYANNSFKLATTPISATITQTIVNTQDNQGNILL